MYPKMETIKITKIKNDIDLLLKLEFLVFIGFIIIAVLWFIYIIKVLN